MCITNLEKESGWQNGQRGLADFLGILVKNWNVTSNVSSLIKTMLSIRTKCDSGKFNSDLFSVSKM